MKAKWHKKALAGTLALAAGMSAVNSAQAQAEQAQGPMGDRLVPQLPAGVKSTFVPLVGGVPAVLYEPTNPGPKAQIAFYVMHASADYLSFVGCTELPKRGYRILCVNNSSSKSGTFDDGIMDRTLLQSKAAVTYLRKLPGVSKVLLLGHSGGATIITAYQAIAEQGVTFCNGAEKIHACGPELAGMPAGDGVVLADANWGQAEMVLLSQDPGLSGFTNGTHIDPALDMYNPANGFKPGGTRYSNAFRQKFLTAQGARSNAILKHAQDRLALIEAGKGDFNDDESFTVPGGFVAANKLFSQDTSLLEHSAKPWPLVHKDGSVTTQIIHSVRAPGGFGGNADPSPSMMRGALKTTVRNFLSSYAIRVTPRFGYNGSSVIDGVDWTSTYASPPGNVEGITKPLLTLA